MSRVFHYSGVAQKENRVASNTRSGGRRIMDHVFAGQHQAIPYTVRLAFYVVATVALVQMILFFVERMQADSLFLENGLLEWVQIFLLLLCVLFLQAVAPRVNEIREGVFILSFLPLLACVRELDHIFDTYFFDGAWQLIALSLSIYLGYFAVLHRHKLKTQVLRILASPPTGLFFAGFLTVMVFSRMMGQRSFWELALQEDYLRLVSRITEESIETFGYLLLLFGCIELFIFALSCKSDHGSGSESERTLLKKNKNHQFGRQIKV